MTIEVDVSRFTYKKAIDVRWTFTGWDGEKIPLSAEQIRDLAAGRVVLVER